VARALVLVVPLLVGLATPALAQSLPPATLGLQVTGPTAPLVPDTGAQTVWLNLTMACSEAARFEGADGAPPRVTLRALADVPSVAVRGNATANLSMTACTSAPTGNATAHVPYVLQASREAPGETPLKVRFTAKVESGNTLPEQSPSSEGAFAFTVAPLLLLTASVPATILQAAPGHSVAYTIELRNLGNTRSVVDFSVDPAADSWIPVAPAQVSLESEAQGGTRTTATVTFVVAMPPGDGWSNKEHVFDLHVRPQSTQDPTATGKEIVIHVLARERGWTFGPLTLATAGAIVLVAAAAAIVGTRLRGRRGA